LVGEGVVVDEGLEEARVRPDAVSTYRTVRVRLFVEQHGFVQYVRGVRLGASKQLLAPRARVQTLAASGRVSEPLVAALRGFRVAAAAARRRRLFAQRAASFDRPIRELARAR
jgi:hypothetical protein